MWYWLVVGAAWVAVFAWWALWLRRKWAREDATDAPVVASVDAPQPARWEVCGKCKGLCVVRVPMGTHGSFPMKCSECLGDGVVPVYARRASDSTDAAGHVRPMGARSLGLPKDGGR